LSADYSIRHAKRKDSHGIQDLLVALANFEHLDPPDDPAKRRIIHDIFSDEKLLRTFVAADIDSGKLVGYALYFYTYSSFLARPTLYLEDIFVLEEYRHRGIGRDLFIRCAAEAEKNGCGRMEWSVLTWNKRAIDFYEKLGANRLEEWYYYRLSREGIEKLTSGLRKLSPRANR
jgi:GNAT superfamily N-acetyltransferase